MPDTFSIAVVQMRVAPDAPTNLAKAEAAIADAAKAGAQIVCLPELFLGPYFCQVEDASLFDAAEAVPGPHTERLGHAAKKNGVVVVGSLFERHMAGLYFNTATVHDADGSYLGKYRKTHIPDDPLYYEKYYFTPGDLGFQCLRHEVREGRHARLLGSMVPGSGPAHGVKRGRGALLPHGHRLAPEGKGPIRRGPARGVGDEHARPCRGEWHLRGSGQPHRP